MRRFTRVAMVAAGLLTAGTAALGQTAWVEVKDGDAMVEIVVVPRAYNVEDLQDMEVVGAAGEEIGEVEKVLASTDGTMAIVTEVGGFLGVGEREVVIPLADAKIVGEEIVLNLTKEQIEALEDWAQ